MSTRRVPHRSGRPSSRPKPSSKPPRADRERPAGQRPARGEPRPREERRPRRRPLAVDEGQALPRRGRRRAGVPPGEAARRPGGRGDVRHHAACCSPASRRSRPTRGARLAALDVDPKKGTTLYDGLVQSARALGDETQRRPRRSSWSPTATRRAAPPRSRTRSRSPARRASPSTSSRSRARASIRRR